MLKSLLLTVLGLHATLSSDAADGTPVDIEPSPQDDTKKTTIYVFDQDAAGAHCEKATQDHSEEDFRLYCINQVVSFRHCALTCSSWLNFEGSTGECKSHRCDFYGHTFPMDDASSLSMSQLAQGKVTLFAFGPLWEGHAQYIYELLEAVRGNHKDTTEAMFLPIDIHDPTITHPRFELTPFDEEKKRVHILPEVKPSKIGGHPFLSFVRSLVHKEGYANFDVYTDRPVIFAVSHDGYTVERLVVPTLEELEGAIERLGKQQTSKIM